MMSLLAATLGPSGVAAGRMNSGGLSVALPCASAKRSRLLPEVFGDCSFVGCKLSPRMRTIIGEGIERDRFFVAFEMFWRLAALVVLSHVEKWRTLSCPQDVHHLQCSSATARESCHRGLFVDF